VRRVGAPGRVGRRVRRGARVIPVVLAGALLAACSLVGGGAAAPATPTPTPRTGPAETRTGVAYATTDPAQVLDLHLPAGDGHRVFPLVVLIHGGGFLEGAPADEAGLAATLNADGFAAASLGYRLSGRAPFPAALQDVKAAVRYVRANARGWGVDPDRIAVFGESAGGYLASMIGATAGETTFDDDALGNPGVSGAVRAVVSWFGPADFGTMDDQARENGCDDAAQQHHAPDSPESAWLGSPLPDVPDRVEEASVVRHVGTARSLPPYLLVHGTQDCTVAPGQSQQLHDALAARGAKVTLTMVDGAAHSDPKIFDEQTGPTLQFLHSVLDA